jgi:hypothetical protein
MRSLDTFNNYRQIKALYDSQTSCGHSAIKGDQIGYNPLLKKTLCAQCWEKWVVENEEANRLESSECY